MDASPSTGGESNCPSPVAPLLDKFPDPPQKEDNCQQRCGDVSEISLAVPNAVKGPILSSAPSAIDDPEDASPVNHREDDQEPPAASFARLGLEQPDVTAMWRDSQTQETATISSTGQLPSPSTPGQLEDAFSYGRTPEQSASAAPLSRSISSEQQSLASSLSRSSSTLGDHRQKPVTIPDPIISDDSRAKKRTSLLGALGIGRGLKKSRVRPNLSQSMISISEGESGSSETARSLDFSLHRKTSFAAFGSRLSTAHPHADSSSLKNDSSNEVRRTPSKLSRSNASPTTSLGLSSPVPSSSTKSIPPFPSMREQLQPFKQRSEFLMKWTSPAFSVRAKSKGSWKPRFVLLCAVPAMKGTDDMPIGGYHFTISTFKSNDMQDQEIERIRLSPDTVVCVTDEIGDGHLFVLKVACAISETPSSEWYFSMNEVSDLTQWLRILKQIVLQLRGVATRVDGSGSQTGSAPPSASVSNFEFSPGKLECDDLASELDASESKAVGLILHPFGVDHFSATAPSSPTTINNHYELHVSDFSPKRTASLVSRESTSTLSRSTSSRTQPPSAPLPRLPQNHRAANPRLSIYSQSSGDTSLSAPPSSIFSNAKRISSSSGGSVISPISSPSGKIFSKGVELEPSLCTPPLPIRSSLRKASSGVMRSDANHFANLPLPQLPASAVHTSESDQGLINTPASSGLSGSTEPYAIDARSCSSMPRRIGLLEELDAVEEARMKVQEYSEGYAISEPRIRFQDSLSPTS